MTRSDARRRRGAQTRQAILDAARGLLAEVGNDLTLEAIASRIGVTRQAVLYHFPTKERVMVELALEAIAAERDVAIDAVRCATGFDAIARYVRALVAFYVADVDRFRLVYMRGQILGGGLPWFPAEERRERLYPVTSAAYAAVEDAVGCVPAGPATREVVVAAHLAAVGFATMYGTTVASGDPMVLPVDRYVDALLVTWRRGFSLDHQR